MAKFIVCEIQRVFAVREVEAKDKNAALQAFWDGEGVRVGRDGQVQDSTLIYVEEA